VGTPREGKAVWQLLGEGMGAFGRLTEKLGDIC
jgi:hypothetical protein